MGANTPEGSKDQPSPVKRRALEERQRRAEELAVLVQRAAEAFAKLSPEEQKAHREAQRKSWVVGEMMLEHPEMTREEAARIYDEVSF